MVQVLMFWNRWGGRLLSTLALLCLWTLGFLGSQARAQQSLDSLTLAGAVKTALASNPDIRTGREEIERFRGRRTVATGAFDTQLQASAVRNRQSNLIVSSQNALAGTFTETGMQYRVGASTRLPVGLTVEPHLQVSRSQTLDSEIRPTNQVRAGVALTYPLWEGRGAEIAKAREDAARHSVDAAQYEWQATASETALQVIRAFWEYTAARVQLNVTRASKERAETLLEETMILVEKDERPASTLDQLRANLGDKQNQLISARQAVLDAKERLGVVMGIAAGDVNRLTVDRRDFPPVPDSAQAKFASPLEYVSLALKEREVLKAARRRETAAQKSRRAAYEQLDPQMDLSVNAEYSGWVRGEGAGRFLSPFDREVGGPTLSVTLSTAIPFQNRIAEGEAAQQDALYRQRKIRTQNVKRTIEIRVQSTIKALKNSIRRVRETKKSTEWHRSVVENEKKKYRLGESTLIDVIIAQDRLDSALLSHAQNRQIYATQLARLRLQTGTLLAFDDQQVAVNAFRFVTLPGDTGTN